MAGQEEGQGQGQVAAPVAGWRPRVPIAWRLLLAVGGISLLVYAAALAVQARMARNVALGMLQSFATDFVESRTARIDAPLREAEATAERLAAGLGERAADSVGVGEMLCQAVAGSGRSEGPAPLVSSASAWIEEDVPAALECSAGAGVPRPIDPATVRGSGGGSGWTLVDTPRGPRPAFSAPMRGTLGAREAHGGVRVEVDPVALREIVRSMKPVRGAMAVLTASGRPLVSVDLPTGERPGPEAEAPDYRDLASRLDEASLKGRFEGDFPGLPGRAFVGYERIPSTGWWLAAAVPKDVLLADLNSLRLRIVALMTAGAALLLGATGLIARGIARPVVGLAGAARSIAAGDLDTEVEVPPTRDEVEDLARSFETMRSSLKSHIAEVERLAAARARLEGDLQVARQIQQGLLTTDFQAVTRGFGADLHAVVVPARQVGGDLYDAFRLDDRRACLVLGDVSGKGIPASLFMTAARTLLRALAPQSRGPADLLARVNDELAAENPRSMFVTAFCGVVDLAAGRVVFANAGHLPPVVVAAQGPAAFGPEVPGLPLGLIPGAVYEDTELTLSTGDTLVLYTDGVTEALDPADALFDPERLVACLSARRQTTARGTVESVLESVRAFAGTAPQSDDIGLLALRWDGSARRSVGRLAAP